MIYSAEIYLEPSLACYREVPFQSNSPDMALNWRNWNTWLKAIHRHMEKGKLQKESPIDPA